MIILQWKKAEFYLTYLSPGGFFIQNTLRSVPFCVWWLWTKKSSQNHILYLFLQAVWVSNKEEAHKVEDVNSRSSPLDLSFFILISIRGDLALKFSIISQVLFTFCSRTLSLYFRLIVPLQSAPRSLISLIFLFSPILRLHIYPRPVKNPRWMSSACELRVLRNFPFDVDVNLQNSPRKILFAPSVTAPHYLLLNLASKYTDKFGELFRHKRIYRVSLDTAI